MISNIRLLCSNIIKNAITNTKRSQHERILKLNSLFLQTPKIYLGLGVVTGLFGVGLEHKRIFNHAYMKNDNSKLNKVRRILMLTGSHLTAFYLYSITFLEYPVYGILLKQPFHKQIDHLRDIGFLIKDSQQK